MALLIDLSMPIFQDMAVYPGDPPVTVETVKLIEHDGFQLTRISLGCHAGTHVDAPRHFLPDGQTVDQLPLERFIGPGLLFEIQPDPEGQIDLSSLNPARVKPGDCLLVATGWHADAAADLASCPTFAPGSSQLLARLGIRLIGTDLPTVVERSADCCLPFDLMHRVLLDAGIPIVENLANLDHLADSIGRRGGSFEFYAVPLAIAGSEGSPVRAFARIRHNDFP